MIDKPELFTIKENDGYILYAPLKRLMARINSSAKNAVGKELFGESLTDDERKVVNTLREYGFFDDVSPPCIPEQFKPVHVTLFPTDACNLRCRYCYASADCGSKKLSLEAAFSAIDMVAKNAKDLKRDNFLIGFHGNGEPFMAFDIIKKVCEYTSEVAQREGVKGFLNTATNGVLSDEQCDFLIAWFTNVNISFDVLPELQNRQRPFPNGSGTFDIVHQNLKRIDKAGLNYGIRSTITMNCADRILEIVEFVEKNYPRCSQLHIEPAWEIGRALDTGEKTPDAEVFIEQYLKAIDKLGNTGLKLVYSGARQDLLAVSFCSVCRGSFTVTADAKVTSCYEVCTADDPRSERFIFGHYDFEKHEYFFSEDKMNVLAKLQVKNMPYCKNCFCKWHCAGDCAAKLLGLNDPLSHFGSARCAINRALTFKQIQRKMETEKGEINND